MNAKNTFRTQVHRQIFAVIYRDVICRTKYNFLPQFDSYFDKFGLKNDDSLIEPKLLEGTERKIQRRNRRRGRKGALN